MGACMNSSKSYSNQEIQDVISANRENDGKPTTDPMNNSKFDFGIFKEANNDAISSKECKSDLSECKSIQRMIAALQYRKIMDLEDNINGNETLMWPLMTEYRHKTLIQDFHHLMKVYDGQIYEIKKLIETVNSDNNCDINTCPSASRHFRVSDNDKTSRIDPYVKVYCDTLDSLYVYLMYSHRMGMRVHSESKDEEAIDGKEQDNDNDCYDHEFARYRDLISVTKDATNRFQRISGGDNKYTINQIQNNDVFTDNKDGVNETYLDSVIDSLYNRNVSEDAILKLINY